ncbi:hypothetical protein O3M35_013316 [Rhynocoris fuscipes]|uniref:Uncharacterized protein n=1 Tax=Rhynocoris fuscipes TaxID=488301 RepID=A0AAW1CEE4_9HEMI
MSRSTWSTSPQQFYNTYVGEMNLARNNDNELVSKIDETNKMKNKLKILKTVESPLPPEPYPQTLPTITDANGVCVNDSAQCVDGATITFTGTDFL